MVETSVTSVPVTTSVPTTTILPPRTTNAIAGWTRLVTVRDPEGTALITSKATIMAGESGKPGVITCTITGANGRLTQALEITVIESTVIGEHTTFFARTMLLVPPEASATAAGERPALGRTDKTKDDSFKGTSAGLPSFWVSALPGAEFLGQALFTFIAILLSLLYRPIDTDIKRMEVWYQLSDQTQGVTGKELLKPDLTFANAFAAPILAAKRKQWIVALSSVIYAPLLSALLLLSSSTLLISAEGLCDTEGGKMKAYCGAYLSIRPNLARALQALLAAIALSAIVLAVLLRLRRPKLLLGHSPFTIAGLALLMTQLEDLEVLGGSDANRSQHDLKQRIANVRFRLAEVVHPDTSVKVVLETLSDGDDVDGAGAGSHGKGAVKTVVGNPRGKRPLMVKLPAIGVLVALLIGTLILVFVYRFAPTAGFQRFMDSSSVGPRVFCVSLGILIRSMWEPITRGTFSIS